MGRIQLSLFDDERERDLEAKCLARRDDPRTSHEAAEEAFALTTLVLGCLFLGAAVVAWYKFLRQR